MYPYSSTGQFANIKREVNDTFRYSGKDSEEKPIIDPTIKLPKLTFIGTTKAHGTNAATVYDTSTGKFEFQSRERTLTLEQDNAGFMLYMSGKIDTIKLISEEIISKMTRIPVKVILYGEWCGGNIMKNVAISGLDKMFLIFSVKLIHSEDDTENIDLQTLDNLNHPEDRIYSIMKFGHWVKEIDFNDTSKVQNEIIEITDSVEEECPIGKFFGRVKTVDNTVGEGVVWTCIDKVKLFRFKVKGDKHSVSKVKTLSAVDLEYMDRIQLLAKEVTPAWRIDQGIENACDTVNGGKMDMAKIGDTIKWVIRDILKEENDRLIEAQLDIKKISSYVSKTVRDYFVERYNKE